MPNYSLKLKDVAELLNAAPVTVRLWTEKGMLKAERTPGGHRRYKLDDVERFAQQFNMSLNREEGPLRILIVDDDPKWLTLLTTVIGKADPNVQVETANSGFAAGQKLVTLKPNIVLLDIRMPGISGLDVCKNIRTSPELADTRIIAITGFASDTEQQRLLDAGAEACLSKPLNFAEFFSLIGLTNLLT